LHPGQTYRARDPLADIEGRFYFPAGRSMSPTRRKFVQLRLTFARNFLPAGRNSFPLLAENRAG
jgi:hypothetical protein